MKLLSERLAYVYQEMPELEGERGQTGLIKASGATKSVVNQWLNEKIKTLDIKYALNIERNLGWSHIWLMTGEGPMREAPKDIGGGSADPFGESAQSFAELQLLLTYRRSDARERAAIEGYLKSLRMLPKTGDRVDQG